MMMFLVKPVCLASSSSFSANSMGTLKPIGFTPRFWSLSFWIWFFVFVVTFGIFVSFLGLIFDKKGL